MSTTDSAAPTESRNERRRRLTDEKIAAAVLRLALEAGPSSITFSGVSAKSGVAKTTLYRRYTTKEELLDAVAQHFAAIPEDSDETPTTPEGLATTLRRGVDTLEEYIGLPAIGALLASQDEFLRGLRHKVFSPQVATAVNFFHRGVDAGAFRNDVDYSLVADLIYGGMIMRSAKDGKVNHSWADAVVELIWPLITKETS